MKGGKNVLGRRPPTIMSIAEVDPHPVIMIVRHTIIVESQYIPV